MKDFLSILKNNALFNGLTDEELLKILACIDIKKIYYDKDNFILHSGETTQYMYFIVSGSVLIIQEDVWGRRNIMDKLMTGHFFAESFAASKGSILNVSALADEATIVLQINLDSILKMCSVSCSFHNKVIQNFVTILAEKNIRFSNKISHTSKKTTKEKLMSYLSSESISKGRLDFDIPFNRQQLADYLNVERAAMSVELSKLQKDGLLTYTKNHFSLNADMLDNE